jgi:hypothetical protein
MNLRPGRVREILGLSQDTYRHWKAALQPLANRNGYRPCFTYGDLLAMALVSALTEAAGVRVGALQAISSSLFDYCAQHSWAELERSTLVLDIAAGRVNFNFGPHIPQLNGIAIVVPCRPIIAHLRERLFPSETLADQANLHFPPTVVLSDTRQRGAS